MVTKHSKEAKLDQISEEGNLAEEMEKNEQDNRLQEEQSSDETKENQETFTTEGDDDSKFGKRMKDVATAFLKLRINWWELKRWNDYLYKTRELDCLELPVLNTYLSDWGEDLSYDPETVFQKCDECLKLIPSLEFAIAACPNATDKQLNLWKEGLRNIKSSISKKLDYVSFMHLKNANNYLNPKTGNMEHFMRYGDETNPIITICLWENLYRPVRKQGISAMGYSFKLPKDLVADDCAVRLMHTLFDHISSDLYDKEKDAPEETETEDVVPEMNKTDEEVNEEIVDVTQDIVEVEVEEEGGQSIETDVESPQSVKLDEEESSQNDVAPPEEVETQIDIDIDEQPESDTDSNVFEESLEKANLFESERLPSLEEPEPMIVDFGEYFPVCGIFHFELLVVPTITVRTKMFTYIYGEKPRLRRIHYKRKIVPPREPPDGDTAYSFSAYEKVRFQRELKDAIFVQLQLPKRVMLLGSPEPARLYKDKGGYSKDFIFDVQYSKETRGISFKTNQFGTFAILQRKYQNFPYKRWILKGGDNVQLTLEGRQLEIQIQISNEGYSVKSLHPDEESLISEVSSTFILAENFMQALFRIGINIEVKQDAEKYENISLKEYEMENKVYDCIALLIKYFSFNSMSGSLEKDNRKDRILLEFQFEREKTEHQIVIYKDRVEYFEKEEKEEIQPKKSEFSEESKDDETSEEKEQELDKKEEKMQVEEKPLFSDLYQFALNLMDENEEENITSTDICLIENVRSLLKICRPISSM